MSIWEYSVRTGSRNPLTHIKTHNSASISCKLIGTNKQYSQTPRIRTYTAQAVPSTPFLAASLSGSKTSRREGPAPDLTDLIGDGYTRPIREGDGSTPWIGGSGFAGGDRRRRFLGGSAAAARDGRRLAAGLGFRRASLCVGVVAQLQRGSSFYWKWD
ncbi:hypothetical protein F2Q70_00011082 [Brassica cretica]|uniref:Uncharacterized protein n=1 Tax=Brassica cretica TaxID=69181 RepID=A0A8S9LYV9_BRACR|nr:hypothetical protein F2Q70_00011082 [Brassica cretica]